MKATEKAAIIKAGNAHLRAWLKDAKKHGTIYYRTVYGRGCRKTVQVWTIRYTKGKPFLAKLWPSYEPPILGIPYGDGLDVLAKHWGFSFKARAFIRDGSGYNPEHDVVYTSALKAFSNEPSGYPLDYIGSIYRESL